LNKKKLESEWYQEIKFYDKKINKQHPNYNKIVQRNLLKIKVHHNVGITEGNLHWVGSSYYAKNNHTSEIDTTSSLKMSNNHVFYQTSTTHLKFSVVRSYQRRKVK